jgi:hypothetical protein
MKIQSRVAKQGNRKHIEIPTSVSNNFEIGETVIITKLTENKLNRNELRLNERMDK